MNPQTIFVVNRSTLVTDADVRTMTAAVDTQMRRDVEPAWHLRRTPVRYSPNPPTGARTIVVVDTADDPQALGYHTDDTAPAGIVGCKPELDHGAHPLTGPYSVASILSHEVLEMAVDPSCNLWADTGQGYLVAVEVGDPVQSDHYDIAGCSVSNFALPAWFDPTPDTAGAKVDHLSLLSAPFTLSRGGYWIEMRNGAVSQRFGAQMPDWLIATKASNPVSRTSRRSSRAVSMTAAPSSPEPVRCYDRTCRHHHAPGDPLDPSLITGPPCAGCHWCQWRHAKAAQ